MEKLLFIHFDEKGALGDLSADQLQKFKFACKKSVVENPSRNFKELCITANIYLNLIRDFPHLDLGGLK